MRTEIERTSNVPFVSIEGSRVQGLIINWARAPGSRCWIDVRLLIRAFVYVCMYAIRTLGYRFGSAAPLGDFLRCSDLTFIPSLASRTVYSRLHMTYRDQNQQSQQPQAQSPNPNGPTAYANGPGSALPRGEYVANGGDVEMRASMFG